MARITDDAYDMKYKAPTYKAPPKYVTPKTSYAPQYREEPYDNTGAMRAAEQARLLREAQVRQAAQLAAQRQAEMVAMQQKQAAIAKAQQSRISLGGGASAGDLRNAWNSYTGAIGQNWNTVKNAIPPLGIGKTWNNMVQNRNNANFEMTNLMNSIFGYPTMESWQRPGAQTGTTYFPGYQGGYPGARASFPNYNVNIAPGWGEDFGMSQMGNTASKMASGWQDQANWGKGVPSWEEILARAVPWAADQYDPAGYPGDTPVDVSGGGGGGGGYGGYGSYSSKPGYYGSGGSGSYAKNYYENLLQWNI